MLSPRFARIISCSTFCSCRGPWGSRRVPRSTARRAFPCSGSTSFCRTTHARVIAAAACARDVSGDDAGATYGEPRLASPRLASLHPARLAPTLHNWHGRIIKQSQWGVHTAKCVAECVRAPSNHPAAVRQLYSAKEPQMATAGGHARGRREHAEETYRAGDRALPWERRWLGQTNWEKD